MVMLTLVGLVAVQARTAVAAMPGNNDFANATAISELPFNVSGDLTGTTTEPDEPQPCSRQVQTVWYVFTPTANSVIELDVDGSDSGVGFSAYQAFGGGFGGLQFLGCRGGSGSFDLDANSGMTYYFQVGSVSTGTASTQFHVREVPPPPNDDFAKATPVTALPFSDTVDHLIAATTEPGEPVSCAGGAMQGSVWWVFTATTARSYLASLVGPLGQALTVYTGSSLRDLSIVSCSSGERVAFRANAGTTYYVRAQHYSVGLDFPMFFRLEPTPEPVADFNFFSSDLSIFRPVQFIDSSSDPAWVGIQSQAWTFGDGATADSCCPTHQYARDGDYTVALTVTTIDGRTASASHVVHISTHDVAIVRIDVPTSARVGQTIKVNVYVKNYRQLETVHVPLFKSNYQGFEGIDSRTQTVPVSGGTTKFGFTYTILETDGQLRKVSFKAVAEIVDHPDALPADNEHISSPVTIRPR